MSVEQLKDEISILERSLGMRNQLQALENFGKGKAFVLKCPHFHDIRCKYIKKYYWKKALVYKYIQLFARNFKELCNLGCYLQHAFERREIIIFWLTCVHFYNIQHHAT